MCLCINDDNSINHAVEPVWAATYMVASSNGSIFRVNTLRPRANGRHFVDDIFECIFLNENASIAIKISLKFVPNGPINNIPALVQIMAWRRPGDKPLSEPMMVSLPTHICVTRPQWVNGPFTGGFHSQRPVFFNLHLNKRLRKQWKAGDLSHNHAHYNVTVIKVKVNFSSKSCKKT